VLEVATIRIVFVDPSKIGVLCDPLVAEFGFEVG